MKLVFMTSFTRGLVLKQRHEVNLKSLIESHPCIGFTTNDITIFQGSFLPFNFPLVICNCIRYNVRSDWLVLRHYSPVMPTGRFQACKTKALKATDIINNLLKSSALPCCLAIRTWSIRHGLGLRFSLQFFTLG